LAEKVFRGDGLWGVGRRYQIRLHFILRKAVTRDGIFWP
jgi:hypothetical protein